MTEIGRLYDRIAASFDRDRGRHLMERPWLEAVRAELPAGAEVLDLGCGMGEPIARYFIDAGFRVTGVDAAPALLGLARARFPAMTWLDGDMRGLDLGRTFAAVLAWDSFFHLEPADQRAMFPVFARHAAPGAPLLFTSGPREGVAIGEIYGERLYHASLDPADYRTLLHDSGFQVLRHRAEDPDCGGHTIWLARRTGGG